MVHVGSERPQTSLLDTINRSHTHRHALFIDFLRKLLPRRCQPLTPGTLGSKEIHKRHGVILQPFLEIFLGQLRASRARVLSDPGCVH
jgi:hypothetical protein